MTETLSDPSAEHSDQPKDSARRLGETALNPERPQQVAIGDLVRDETSHIYDEFVHFAGPQKFAAERQLERASKRQRNTLDIELERHLMMPKIIFDFVQHKTTDFMQKRGEHPILEGVEPVLPRKMVIANLRQLHFDRAKGRTQNQGDFLAKQEANVKIATDLSGSYPQVLFAQALHDAFAENNDPKYAKYTSDVTNAIGRTLRILGSLHQAKEEHEQIVGPASGV